MRISDGRDEDVREGFSGVWRTATADRPSARAAEQMRPRKVGRSTGPRDPRKARNLDHFRDWLTSLGSERE